ncbi:MAG: D-TA family PLP-dependent enzyme [Bacteroidia bacterium]|nr:D-TA family PLP-dependent enzyme [Bacteroidia bacterium]
METWYTLNNVDELDSPALVVFPERIKENIRILKEFVPDSNRLRPHVKTNKCAEVCQLLMDAGISKFKCATIAEAEMLAMLAAPDVLLAYQPVGPRGVRLSKLIKKYPSTQFSCLIDNEGTACELSATAIKEGIDIKVFLDLNVGMNRTGIIPEKALSLFKYCQSLTGIVPIGLHAYDGHHNAADLAVRTKGCDEGFLRVESLQKEIALQTGVTPTIVTGGNTTLSIHAKRKNAECSPGTFIFWDYGYHKLFTELHFVFAALLVTRILSKPDDETICIDLGHKSVASENPLDKRVHFLNAPELRPHGHSEEHLILKAEKNNSYKVGDILYGVPFHICPTVALHESVVVAENNRVTGSWNIVARKRKISI